MQPAISKKSLSAEIIATTAIILIVSHILFRLRFIAFVDEYLSVFVAVMLLYIPIAVMWKRGREIDFLDRGLGTFLRSVATFVIAALIVFPAFFFIAHFWEIHAIGLRGFRLAAAPSYQIVLFQILLVALPEEFYFRGYVQSAMNAIFPSKWRILGVDLGWGWILTALIFAIAHSIIVYRWWHFAIFFPALLFGYLRERTGSITAPILFHAASNILMNWFSRGYY